MKLTEREKAYHDGYKQGRFDEYAERMGYDQAEKVKAKIDKQKNCPYCHPGSNIKSSYGGSAWNNSRLDFESVKDDPLIMNNGECCYGDISFDPERKMLSSIGDGVDLLTVRVRYCPMCGRPLNEEEALK